MKVINFLNQDIKNLENPIAVEEINKTYWYKTQAWIEMRHKFKTKNMSQQQQQQMMDGQQQRFRQLMLCLPEVRSIAGRLQELHLEKVPLMLKALLHTIKVSNPVQNVQTPVVAVVHGGGIMVLMSFFKMPVSKILAIDRSSTFFLHTFSQFFTIFTSAIPPPVFTTKFIPTTRPANNPNPTPASHRKSKIGHSSSSFGRKLGATT